MSIGDQGGPSVPPLRGVVYIHSCPRALTRHIEWAIASVLGPGSRVEWNEQPVQPGSQRTELSYRAPAGAAARLASEMRTFPGVRFEITQEQGAKAEGERYACTPSLGVFRAAMGPHGDVTVHEERLRAALARAANGADLETEIGMILGVPWDDELEAFRCAGDGALLGWVDEVG